MTNMKIGDKVWYIESFGRGRRRPAILVGFGDNDGVPVVDVKVENAADVWDRDRWGYLEQIEPRK